MQTLLTVPPTGWLWALAVLLVAGVGGFFYYLSRLEQPLKPYNSIKYEFAATPERATKMFKHWGSTGMAIMRRSLHLDFAFMPVYAFACAACTLLAGRSVSGATQTLSLWLVPAPFVAWALDIVENLGLLAALDRYQNPPAQRLAVSAAAAGVKFTLLLLCVLYILGAMFHVL